MSMESYAFDESREAYRDGLARGHVLGTVSTVVGVLIGWLLFVVLS